jgi:hypothetical protein
MSERLGMRTASAVACAVVGFLCAACDDHRASVGRDAGPSEPSPNASILPAPLASNLEAPGNGKSNPEDTERRDAGHLAFDAGADAAVPEPHSLREDQALPGETPRENTGLTLTARLRFLDTAPVPRVPEQNGDGVQRGRDAAGFDVVVDLAGSRMRLAFASRAFALPAGSELHTRDDLYGHTLLWPNRTTYTVIAPGALRSVLAQQRADVVPLVRARVSALPSGSSFGMSTERSELSTPTGKLELEQARGPSPVPSPTSGIWASGVSLCQFLVELVGASPTSSACRSDLVPVRAMYTWPNGEHFAFDVSRLLRRNDIDPTALAMPPAGAEFRQSELPPPPPTALLSDSELTEFRSRPAARTEKADPGAPKTGLLVANHGESLRYITIDGAPVARLPPGAEQLLLGLRSGKYQVTARDFFGSEDAVTKSIEVPARFTLGDDTEKSH